MNFKEKEILAEICAPRSHTHWMENQDSSLVLPDSDIAALCPILR